MASNKKKKLFKNVKKSREKNLNDSAICKYVQGASKTLCINMHDSFP